MDSVQDHLDDISDGEWSQDGGPHGQRGQVDSHQEYNEARRLLRDMDNYFDRDKRRGFMTFVDDDEGNQFFDHDCPSDYEDDQAPIPSVRSSSFHCPR